MKYVALLALILAAAPVAADTAHQHSPYAGEETRDIMALSPEEIADLTAGRGMGLALTAEQQRRTSELLDAMRQEASALGGQLIKAERTLDRLFAEQRATPDTVAAATEQAGAIGAKLRAAHLRYHLAMMDVLTTEQVAAYNHLRGYATHH